MLIDDNATSTEVTRPAETKDLSTGFYRSLLQPDVKIEIGMPMYPSTLKDPLTFFLDLEQGPDYEKENAAFLALKSDDRKAARFDYDVECIALLSTRAPLNLKEFPELDQAVIDQGNYKELRAAIRAWFKTGDPVQEKALALIARYVIGKYWGSISPMEYL